MPHRPRLIPLLIASLLALVAVPTTASAGYQDIYKECGDGVLSNSYSAKELQLALQHLAASGDYNNCSDAIYLAQTGGTKKTSGKTRTSTSGGGGSTSPGAGTGGTSGTGGTGGAVSGTTAAPTELPDPVDTASDASTEENQAAVTTAMDAAKAQDAQELQLQNVKMPASAVDLGASGAAVPLPLLLALIAGGAAACAAGAATVVQVVRRRRAG